MDYQDTEHYKTGLNEYLAEGIDYCTNTIKFAEQGDLEQLAADSFHAGYLRAMAEATNENSGLHLQRVMPSGFDNQGNYFPHKDQSLINSIIKDH